MLKIFIDTEFTDFTGPQLISVGLAAESGETFYAELQFDYLAASEFVFEHVIPLLTPEISALSHADFRLKLSHWLNEVRPGDEDVEICFDFDGDFMLLDHAAGELPKWCRPRRVGAEVSELLRREFFMINSLPDHHALNDAMALRYSFEKTAMLYRDFEPKALSIPTFLHTETGPRKKNEDSASIVTLDDRTIFAIVADGMGGHAGGETASSLAVQTAMAYFNTGASIVDSAMLAHKAIILESARNRLLAGMGTTLTAIAISNSWLNGAHVGDSHAYLVRKGEVLLLTDDHSVAGQKLALGLMTEKESKVHPDRNRLDYACGMDWGQIQIQPFSLELHPGDRILLSTDGLHDKLLRAEIAEASTREHGLERFCRTLVALARARRLSDNLTLIGLEYSFLDNASFPRDIRQGSCICIGCGCDDEKPCAGGCHWIQKDRERGAGICSNCTAHMNAWERAGLWPK